MCHRNLAVRFVCPQTGISLPTNKLGERRAGRACPRGVRAFSHSALPHMSFRLAGGSSDSAENDWHATCCIDYRLGKGGETMLIRHNIHWELEVIKWVALLTLAAALALVFASKAWGG